MIKAVIFDMDGLLIDSEPLWRKAEVKVFNEFGVPVTLERCRETAGLRIDEVVKYWESEYSFQDVSKEKIISGILEEVIGLIKSEGEAMGGVDKIIAFFESQKTPMAIVSSSSMRVINAVLDKINVKEKMKIIHSAENELFGKPHPGVYITTAQKLGVSPSECLAFEDSKNGVLSAKSAKMKCVAVPDPISFSDKQFGIADLVIKTLDDFNLDNFNSLNI